MFQTLQLDITDHIAHLRLNRPQALNAMNQTFWQEFPQALAQIGRDASVRVLVLSSTGKHFSAGLDVSLLADLLQSRHDDEAHRRLQFRHLVLQVQEAFTALEKLRVPVLAAVQGGCLGGGLDMVVCADLRLCTADAFFCIAEIDQGLTADVGSLQRLPHLLPQGLVRELAYTGRRFLAAEALQQGFVNAVYADHESLLQAAMAMARTIACKSPMAIQGSKVMLNYARDHTVADALDHVATWNAAMIFSTDLRETLNANQERRPPQYADVPVAPERAFD